MSVQDPFVLDHNTTSNVSERLRGDIVYEFQRASALCCNLIDYSDSIDNEHSGIAELLSDTVSSVSSLAPSLQLALSPSQRTDDNVASNSEACKETGYIQLFMLMLQDSVTKLSTATAEHLGVTETQRRVMDAAWTVSWHENVVGTMKVMLADIFDMECVCRDQPSKQFDTRLNQLLNEKANRGCSGSVLSGQQVGCGTSDGGKDSPRSTAVNDCITDDSAHCKRRLLEARCNNSEQNTEDLSAAKRPKTSNGRVNYNLTDSGQQSTIAGNAQHILLSLDCSALSRLWVSRKKVRRRFMHFSSELKIQLEVSAALRKEIVKSDSPILEFELAVIRPVQQSSDELILAVLPSVKTSKEFGCFITFFVSLVQKLINNVTIEGPVFR